MQASFFIGDEGLEVVARSCKRLKRLRIQLAFVDELQDLPLGVSMSDSSVTQRGLIAIAEGCPKLESLAIFVNKITNEALVSVGENLKNLREFRLGLINLQENILDLPLDIGVRELLRGCTKLKRVYLNLRLGCISNIGLGYIGEFGRNIKRLFLYNVVENDDGLHNLSSGCHSLEKLLIRGGNFTDNGLSTATLQLRSLRYIWAHGYRGNGDVTEHIPDERKEQRLIDIRRMNRPYWNIELILGENFDEHGVNEDEINPSYILAYYSLAGRRSDLPIEVWPLN